MQVIAPPRSSRWKVRPVDQPEVAARLSRELNNLPEALVRALLSRGIEDFEGARRFFRPGLETLHDPFLMRDMEAGADRLARAVKARERVLVYGDYDVDGVTSTAMMVRFLQERGVEASYFIPDRLLHGYGLSPAGIQRAVADGATLMVALDCGITAVDQALLAHESGVDLIICDHHTPGEALPEAVAVLDPKRSDCSYPYKGLSGCGVGYKLVEATLTRLGEDATAAHPLLDLVAVSIAADIVPIDGENRALMTEGLRRIREAPSVGLAALAAAARTNTSSCSTSDIVFGIAPRLNAAGRLDDACKAVALLLEQDTGVASRAAMAIEKLNEERRAIDRQTVVEAEQAARRLLESRSRSGIVLHNPDWHAGVIGITASRIVERYFKPTVMLTTVGGVAKGSARSVPGINVYDVLAECADLLTQFGGHDYAAGLQLPEEHVPDFRDRFDAAVHARMRPELMTPVINVDAPVMLDEIDARFWAVLRQFEPFGPANPRPLFVASDLEVVGRATTVGRDDKHLRFSARSRSGNKAFQAIGFGLAGHLNTLLESQRSGTPFEMVFSLDENDYRGKTSLQLKPRDIRLGQ